MIWTDSLFRTSVVLPSRSMSTSAGFWSLRFRCSLFACKSRHAHPQKRGAEAPCLDQPNTVAMWFDFHASEPYRQRTSMAF